MDKMWKRTNNSNSAKNPPSPYVQRFCKSAPCSPAKAIVKKAINGPARADSFHVVHNVPAGDTPYVKAKHVQLVEKEPERAIALFWAAINAGDRVDSALKDMAIVMKQQNRPEEAIEAIKSLRSRCSDQAQESLDNVLLDLYKNCGRLNDQIALLKHKLDLIYQGLGFNGKRTKTAKSQGKKFQVSIEQEATRLLGNLGWAYMQQSNYIAAETVFRKALSIELDNNKVCNLSICLMHQGRVTEAKSMLQKVKPDSHLKSYDRAQDMLREIEGKPSLISLPCIQTGQWKHIEIPVSVDWDASALNAKSGFGPFPCPENYVSDGFGKENVNTNNRRTPLLFPEETEILRQRLDKISISDGFGNENVNINNRRTPLLFPQETEILRQRLDKISISDGFGNENVNTNNRRTPLLFPQETEILRQRLDRISLENETWPSFIGENLQSPGKPFSLFHSLDIEAKLSFLGQGLEEKGPSSIGHHRMKNETRPSSRRSLSFESVGIDLPPLPEKAMTMTNSNTESLLTQDNNIDDSWDILGFIEAPDRKDFEQIAEAPNSICPVQQRKCHDRFSVFHEMTLPSSPKA